MKKICYVLTISGTVRSFFIEQLRYLVCNGIEVTVVCSEDKHLQEELGNTIHFEPVEIPRGVALGGMLRAISELKGMFKKEKFDLVQYSTPNAAFCASIAARLAHIKIRNYHLMGFRYLGANGIARAILKIFEKITCKNSTHIECVSESNRKLGIAEGVFKEEKTCVVGCGSTGGVDLGRFDYGKRMQWRTEIRRENGFSEDDFVYGFVGRITKDKGIDELLEAFLQLQDGSKLLLTGRFEEKESLNQELLSIAMSQENIVFLDAVDDIERIYAALDVLVLPSYREGFGNVVIEAAAVGTPAIVSNIPGPTDAIIDGETAYTVQPKNAESLLDAMKKVHTKECSITGEKALQFVREHFDSRALCEQILERKKRLLLHSGL